MLFCRLQEKHTREKLRDHLRVVVATQTELKVALANVGELKRRIQQTHEKRERLLATTTRWAE